MLLVYKNLGETPLESLQRLRSAQPELADEKLSYAGRLDPMAEGLMVIMVGEENKQREEYLGFDKTYEFQILVGVSTDTYDSLGVVTGTSLNDVSVDSEEFGELLNELKKRDTWEYAPYSSKTVDGKQLWQYARDGELDAIELPTYTATINALDIKKSEWINGTDVINEIERRGSLVTGDFRQKEILGSWQYEIDAEKEYQMITASVSCTSGFYVRVLCNLIGQKMGTEALAWTIKRTRVGGWSL